MNRSEQQFFALLRSGLWNRPIDETLFTGEVDWGSLLRIAQKQTVLGILFEGIRHLSSALQPPTMVTRKLYQTVLRIEQSHRLLNRYIAAIVAKLESEGIRPILLKGQGVAQNYPHPLRRQCGDIDLFVGKENCEKAMQVVTGLGAEPRNKSKLKSIKHEGFYIHGVSLELHFLVEKLRNPRNDQRFQPWVKNSLEQGKCRKWEIDGVEISLPPIPFDAFFIFHHTFHHFISGGVGLRQLCDWIIYLHTFHNTIDKEALWNNLKDFGDLKAWQVFSCIAVDEMGLDEKEMPFYTSAFRQPSQRVLQKIMAVGNFGFHNPKRGNRPPGYLSGKLHSLRVKQQWLWHLFPIFPKEVFDFNLWYWKSGLNAIIKGG